MSSISSRGAQVVVCSVITVFIATIAVFLRFFTRRRILHVLGYEDWCILAALFFSFGNTTGMIFRKQMLVLGRVLWGSLAANILKRLSMLLATMSQPYPNRNSSHS
ncbi:hypothetical protein BGZ60DRAFT_71940 [Tricladium varicosporioides]|nr:hypothetical protein BGZ60DRAFT_71940 [Hymenoscyphus varicosporioides]